MRDQEENTALLQNMDIHEEMLEAIERKKKEHTGQANAIGMKGSKKAVNIPKIRWARCLWWMCSRV